MKENLFTRPVHFLYSIIHTPFTKFTSLLFSSCVLLILDSYSQAGQWTWVKGDQIIHPVGIFGTQGIPGATNRPPGLYGAASFIDVDGNLWLFGGNDGLGASFNTLWKYTIADDTWTWMKGGNTSNNNGVYGTIGVPSPTNNPGSRAFGFFNWTDHNGDFWIYGGNGYNNTGTSGPLADLWKYTVSTNEWTWMKGSTLTYVNPVYGTIQVPGPNNTPGYRIEGCTAWTDADNNLWFFGGGYYADAHNDIWKYDPVLNQWTWMAGNTITNLFPYFGTKGVYSANNTPGGRLSYCKWTDLNGTFWYFGGGENTTGADLWQYDPVTNLWRWVSGSNVGNSAGVYDTLCASSTTVYPSSRSENRASWLDLCGRLWLYGGGHASINGSPTTNDLWVYDIVDTTWTWVKGNQGFDLPAVWGTIGIPDAANKPAAKEGACTWTDLNGNLWLFGGGTPYWSDATNDLWKFTIDYTCPASGSCNFQPPVASFSVNDSSECGITCLDFFDSTTNNPVSWNWSFQGAVTTSSALQNPTDICYTTAGTYDVTLIVSNGFFSDTITQQVTISIVGGTTISISQNGNQLTCSPPLSSYQWSLNSSPIPGATTQTIVINQTGLYEVTGVDSNGCSISDTFTVTSLQQVSFASSDTLICQKFCMDFFDQSSNNPTSWLWQFQGGLPSSSTAQNPTDICYDNPGTFDVTLITTNGSGSDTLTLTGFITVYPTPAFPIITQSGNTLTSSSSAFYQWQFNSIDIPGATNQSYTATQTGFYSVLVSDVNGCQNSTTLFVEVTGISDIFSESDFSVYPNPSDGTFTIEWTGDPSIEWVRLKILNTLGQVIFSEEELIHNYHFSKTISLGTLPPAVYFLELTTNNHTAVKKLLVTK